LEPLNDSLLAGWIQAGEISPGGKFEFRRVTMGMAHIFRDISYLSG
jgi:hypothetical protein